jgi:hypothetical protein
VEDDEAVRWSAGQNPAMTLLRRIIGSKGASPEQGVADRPPDDRHPRLWFH